MHELHSILDIWRSLEDSNRDAVLATVVHVKGSAYRRPGARMLILPDGTRIGSISGGCLEGDVSRKAWWFTEGGRPSVRIYDTSSDEDAVWEFGLGCNGVIQVMLERVESDSARQALEFLNACRASRRPAVMATVIRTSESSPYQVGNRIFADHRGAVSGGLRDSPLAAGLQPYIQQTQHARKSCLVHMADCEIFVEWIGAPVSLVVFGAGHDAIPVVRIAKQMGWHVTVADGRPAYAASARFPDADRIVAMKAPDLLAGVEITPESVVVLMTHNFPQDAKLLRPILAGRPRYLGLLGPKKRTDSLFAELGLRPGTVDVHAPVGLDIGADTPEGIALSIVAEIQAELAGRPGMKLRHRRDPIHAPADEAGQENRLPLRQPDLASCELAK
jgi:xanthine/CO dehydrogenase XdhC/CoxF family maturation factor